MVQVQLTVILQWQMNDWINHVYVHSGSSFNWFICITICLLCLFYLVFPCCQRYVLYPVRFTLVPYKNIPAANNPFQYPYEFACIYRNSLFIILLGMDPLPAGLFSTSTSLHHNYIIILKDIKVCGSRLVLEDIKFAKYKIN